MDSIHQIQSGKLYQHSRDSSLRVMDFAYNKNKENKKAISRVEKDTPFIVLAKIFWIPNANEDLPKYNEDLIFTLQVLTDQGVTGFISLCYTDLHIFSPANLTS